MSAITLHWFRQDLRLADNPAFLKASEMGQLLPIYILDDEAAGKWAMGGASRWWLHKSLASLNHQLNGKLRIFRGRAADIVPYLAQIYGAKAVSWTRCYEPWRIARDGAIAETLKQDGVASIRLNGSLLWEPWSVAKSDGTPYRVFTPFFRKGCLQATPPAPPVDAPQKIQFAEIKEDGAVGLDGLDLMPTIAWYEQMESGWDVSEAGAIARMQGFLAEDVKDYKDGRNFPAKQHVSRLSPYLHWGQISPNQIWHAVNALAQEQGDDRNLDHFRSELGWREFSHHLLYHNQDLPERPLQRRFAAFDWAQDDKALLAWQKGETGIPIVDAGMRELWQTGYMHNRVRMIVGSFLVKNLRLDWRLGQNWFWDTLVDADLANNSASWQWIAGCGADAAPYFRVFNPVLQAQKFDPDGDYIRQYVPEVRALPDKYLAKPWEAPSAILDDAGVRLDETYPSPIVDLMRSREAALAAFSALD